MQDEPTLGYGDALSISWSITWRLSIVNLVILLVLGGISSLLPTSMSKGIILAAVLFLLDLCVAWPLILNNALSAYTGTVRLNIYGSSTNEGFEIPYRRSLFLALFVEVATIIFVVLTIFVLLLAGVHIEHGVSRNGINLMAVVLRLFVVVPLGIKFFSRKF